MQKIEKSQIAVMNICYQFYPFEYFLDSVARMGVFNIDLWAGYPHLLIGKGCEERLREIRKQCNDRALKIVCLTPKQIGYPLNIADSDPQIRVDGITYLKRCIDAAAILETDMLQLVPGWGFYNQPVGEAWKRAAESLQTLADYAGEAEKTLVLEPLQIIESNLVNDIPALERMLKEVGSAWLKAVVDTCHMEKNHETLDEYFTRLGSDIRHIHLNETNQLPWGEGKNSIDTYLSQLNRHDYTGKVTLEVCSRSHYVYADWAMQKNVGYVLEALKRQ